MKTNSLSLLPYDVLLHIAGYLTHDDSKSLTSVSGIVTSNTYEYVMNIRDISNYRFNHLGYLHVDKNISRLPTHYQIYVDELYLTLNNNYKIPSNIVFKVLHLRIEQKRQLSREIRINYDGLGCIIGSIIESSKHFLKVVMLDIDMANNKQIHELLAVYPTIQFVINNRDISEIKYDGYYLSGLSYITTATMCYKNIDCRCSLDFKIRTDDMNYKIDMTYTRTILYLNEYNYDIIIIDREMKIPLPINIIGNNSTVTIYIGGICAAKYLKNITFEGAFCRKCLIITSIKLSIAQKIITDIQPYLKNYTSILINDIFTDNDYNNTFDETEILNFLNEISTYGITFKNTNISSYEHSLISNIYIKYLITNRKSIIHKLFNNSIEMKYIKRIVNYKIIKLDTIPDIIYLWQYYTDDILCNKSLVFDFKITQFIDKLKKYVDSMHMENYDSYCHLKFTDIELYIKKSVTFTMNITYTKNERDQTVICIDYEGRYNPLYVKITDPDTIIKSTIKSPICVTNNIPLQK